MYLTSLWTGMAVMIILGNPTGVPGFLLFCTATGWPLSWWVVSRTWIRTAYDCVWSQDSIHAAASEFGKHTPAFEVRTAHTLSHPNLDSIRLAHMQLWLCPVGNAQILIQVQLFSCIVFLCVGIAQKWLIRWCLTSEVNRNRIYHLLKLDMPSMFDTFWINPLFMVNYLSILSDVQFFLL